MKAVLLAAGLGSRLRPLTDTSPKCLVEIGGRPLLDIWLDALARAGVDEVLVNTHHLAPQVAAHVSGRSSGPAVRLSHEPVLLGSAGTLRANRDFVADEDMFLVVNADTLTDLDLGVLIEEHRTGSSVATLCVFRALHPSECGIVDISPDGRVIGFVEKPAQPRSDLANAGLYAFSPAVIHEIPESVPSDIGFDLLPRLVGRARALELENSYLFDIGTPAALEHARRAWEARTVT